MSKEFNSRKLFNAERKKNKGVDMQFTLEFVKEKIAEYYNQRFSFDILLKRLEVLEYLEKQQNNFLSNMLIGTTSGLIATFLYDVIVLIQGQKTIILTAVTAIFSFFLIMGVIILGFKWMDKQLRQIYSDIYCLYIVPFEKELVISKLLADYEFDYKNPTKRKSKIPSVE